MAGDTLRFSVRGEQVAAAVPAGLRPGDKFDVPVPVRADDVPVVAAPSAEEPSLAADLEASLRKDEVLDDLTRADLDALD